MQALTAFFAGFLPHHVSDGTVLAFLRFFSFPVPRKKRDLHREQNLAQWDRRWDQAVEEGLIERQSLLSGMVLGNTGAEINSCEVIALHNVLLALRDPEALSLGRGLFPALLEECEAGGLALGGAFGTAPAKLLARLRAKGYTYEFLYGKKLTEEALAEAERDCRAFLVTVYNDRDNVMAMIHTMSITREKNGFRVSNGGLRGQSFPSLTEAVHAPGHGKGRPISLICVR